MEYLLFTYPNCQKCEDLKAFLARASLPVQAYRAEDRSSHQKLREFRDHLKRDDKGAVILPTLILRENGAVTAVLNSRQELEKWLTSRG
jgi:glutaredoxin